MGTLHRAHPTTNRSGLERFGPAVEAGIDPVPTSIEVLAPAIASIFASPAFTTTAALSGVVPTVLPRTNSRAPGTLQEI